MRDSSENPFMKHSGIIISVADGFTMITGKFYPLIAPFIGAIGTFMTGSNTSANLLSAHSKV